MKTVFLRAIEAEDKAAALLAAIREPNSVRGRQRFEVEPASFSAVPGSTFAYWAGPSALACYERMTPLRATKFVALSTNQLSDDRRYARLWWEVGQSAVEQWVIWAKGRTFAPFYFDIQTLVRWNPTRETYTGFLGTEHRPLEKPASADWFFRPGLTWPRRSNRLSVAALPSGCVFGNKGPAIFVDGDDHTALLALSAILNSRVFRFLLSLQIARVELAQSFEVGLIQDSPIPDLTTSKISLSSMARRAWSLKRSVDTHIETSHCFSVPALLQAPKDTLTARASAWVKHLDAVESEFATIQAEIDTRCFDLYGINEADGRAIIQGFVAGTGASDEFAVTNVDAAEDDASDEDGDTGDNTDAVSLTAELVSWAVGVAFGRFDVRLASGATVVLDEPEPFDPLPVCSPAMLTGDDGLPLRSAPAGYPLAFPENGILVDDPGQASDITAAIRTVFDEVFNGDVDACWNEATVLLDPQGQDLRGWLASSFFEHHLKRHSKSRRKAPIIWQLAVPSGRYSVWLYVHRLNRDSFFQIQNDVVTPKLAHEERRLASMAQSATATPSAKDRKEIAAQEAFVEELRSFLDEIKRVAPQWNPMLDDGVVLTMAPLWRLVPQHKPWQKELWNKWSELTAGKYDWAHIAMHLWPERVVPKCRTDRSLAIAHGLEDVFWAEGDDGKWTPRPAPTHAVDELVRERTSIAVKAALKSLLEGPVAIANGGRGRGRKAPTLRPTEEHADASAS
jgi:hypothetical protein